MQKMVIAPLANLNVCFYRNCSNELPIKMLAKKDTAFTGCQKRSLVMSFPKTKYRVKIHHQHMLCVLRRLFSLQKS